MQFQKQLFGEPDKKVADVSKLVERFVIEIRQSVFWTDKNLWFVAIDTKVAKGKGSKMGLTEDLAVEDTGPNDWILQGLVLEGGLAQFIGTDLMNGQAVEIVEAGVDFLVVRKFGILSRGPKRTVTLNSETNKFEVGI